MKNTDQTSAADSVRLSAIAAGAMPYAPPSLGLPIDLHLDANEGPFPRLDLAELSARLAEAAINRYPSAAALESLLAARFSVSPARVLVTAGGDEAIDRACRAMLESGRELILPVPTFEMIGRYARNAGAHVLTTPWPTGAYPIDAVLSLITPQTSMIALVSPNNPTGAVATTRDLERLSAAAPHALILVDLAYAEFADEDLTIPAANLPNTIIIRTFSKTFGLAGLRVGYAIGQERIIRALRSVAGPYPVSALSLLAATQALQTADSDLPRTVSIVRTERERLMMQLIQLGARPLSSQANFILATFDDAQSVWKSLAAAGISVRRFASTPGLEDTLRITLPGNETSFSRLSLALQSALSRKLS